MHEFMEEALKEAEMAAAQGEVPVGAVVVFDGKIVGRGSNRMEQEKDATCHAEILAVKEAAASLGRWRLNGCHLYVTLEPCLMCMGAILNSRVERLIVGAADRDSGSLELLRYGDHSGRLDGLEVYEGIMEDACAALLTDFFKEKRN